MLRAMWRVLRSGGALSMLALAAVTACGTADSRPPGQPSPGGMGGAARGGSGPIVIIGDGGSLGMADCSGQLPATPVTRRSIVDLDGAFVEIFGTEGPSLASVRQVREVDYHRELTPAFVQALLRVARERIAHVVADSASFELCDTDLESPSCVAPWLNEWGAKLYRRPLTTEQVDAYKAQFRVARREQTPAQAARNVLLSMVLSPYFVLRIELGDPETGRLTNFEIADRLSHFATSRSPDEELRNSAAEGTLTDPAVRVAQLRRLYRTPEGRRARTLQHLEWFGLDEREVPETLDAELRRDMLVQAQAFVDDVFETQEGGLRALLGSARQPLTPLLAAHYGLPAPAPAPAEEGLQFYNLDSELFAGMLSSGLFLSRFPRAALRGLVVRKGLTCQGLPAHPAQADYTFGPGGTPRERIMPASAQPECAGCHQQIDPIGLALEAFDDQGRLSGLDSQGSITLDGNPVLLGNPGQLGLALATSNEGARCAARHYLEHALDRLLTDDRSSTPGLPSGSGPPPVPQQRQVPDVEWLDCLVRSSRPSNFDLGYAAEQLVSSRMFALREQPARRVTAFDTSLDPVEHALRETAQFRGVFSDPQDEATLERYAQALTQVQLVDVAQPGTAGAGGAGGVAGQSAGGAAGASP